MTMLISTNNDLIHETFIHARTLKELNRIDQRKANYKNAPCLIRGFIWQKGDRQYVEFNFTPRHEG